MLFDVAGYVGVLKAQSLCFGKVSLHLAVKPVPHQLQHDIAVAIDAGALALQGELVKDLIDVCHVEVSAHAKVLGLPVVAAQEGVHV